MAAAGRLDRRLAGTIRLRPPRRPDRPRTRCADPDLRAAWHEALAALGPVDGPDVRGLPDGTLLHLRDTYPIETGWAPQWTGEELRQVRLGAAEARLAAIRATAEAGTARRHGQHETARPAAGPGGQLPGHARRLRANARPSSPRSWPTGSSGRPPPASSGSWPSPPTPNCAAGTPASTSRRCAPPSPSPPREQQRDELTLTAGEEIPQLGQWIADLAAQHRAFAGKLAERQSLMIPAEDPDYEDLGPAFPAWAGPDRDAILQPPKPQIQPSPQILERAVGRDLDMEAAE